MEMLGKAMVNFFALGCLNVPRYCIWGDELQFINKIYVKILHLIQLPSIPKPMVAQWSVESNKWYPSLVDRMFESRETHFTSLQQESRPVYR